MKLYSKLGLENVVDTNKNECCEGNLDDRDEGLELLDSCFNYASDLSENEKASLYYISGYVAFKESLTVPDDVVISNHDAGEYTEIISMGKLTHPPSTLYDVSLYLCSILKHRKMKCCSKIFRDAYKYMSAPVTIFQISIVF